MLQWIESVQQRIGLRLALACFVVSVLTAFSITCVQVWQEREKAVAAANAQLQQIEQVFLPNLIDALWTLDPQRLNAQLTALQQLPLVSEIDLDDESDQHVEIIKRHSNELLARQRYPLRYQINGQTYDLGILTIEIDANDVNQRLVKLATSSLLTSFTALFVGNLVLVWLFHGWVTRQLNQVAEFTKRLNAATITMPLQLKRSQQHANDEIGAIVLAISQMQQQLHDEFARRERAEQELKTYQQQLEQIVSQRTAQLATQTEALTQQSQQLMEQNAELNAFAHTVAHDLKHPLTTIIGMSSLLNQTSTLLSQLQQRQFMSEIHDSATRMNNMINGLLQLASLRSDIDIQCTQVDIQHTLDGALKNLSHFLQDHHAEIHVTTAMPKLVTNGQWVEEIWLNYLSNAVKYGGTNVPIEVGADAPSDTVPEWRFWVRDHGDGVPESRQALLFTEFSRLHMARDDSHGLGLSIVKRICRKLGGRCGCELAEGGGSRFWFTLPDTRS